MATRRTVDRKAYLSALCRTVPYHIVEPVLDNPTEHAISHRVIDGCMMFADLVGFTPMCDRMATSGSSGLSRLSSILDQLFELLLEKGIFPYQGYVIQFGGDSLTVIFQDEGQALRCAASANTLQHLMYEEVGRLLRNKERQLLLRVGIASGTIHLPVIGDMARR